MSVSRLLGSTGSWIPERGSFSPGFPYLCYSLHCNMTLAAEIKTYIRRRTRWNLSLKLRMKMRAGNNAYKRKVRDNKAVQWGWSQDGHDTQYTSHSWKSENLQ